MVKKSGWGGREIKGQEISHNMSFLALIFSFLSEIQNVSYFKLCFMLQKKKISLWLLTILRYTNLWWDVSATDEDIQWCWLLVGTLSLLSESLLAIILVCMGVVWLKIQQACCGKYKTHSFIICTRNPIHCVLEGDRVGFGFVLVSHKGGASAYYVIYIYIYIGQLLLLACIHRLVMKGHADPAVYCKGNWIQAVAMGTKTAIPTESWQRPSTASIALLWTLTPTVLLLASSTSEFVTTPELSPSSQVILGGFLFVCLFMASL